MALFHRSVVFLLFLLVVITSARRTKSISKKEIKEISSTIWKADKQRLSEQDVLYNKKGPRLFTYVNEEKLTGTYKLMQDLFDNYNYTIGIAEKSTQQKEKEIEDFLKALVITPPITTLHNWLVSKKLADKNMTSFKNNLHNYWFGGYSRSGKGKVRDSSGFEHVFLGEINPNKNKVIGFHNWLFAYRQEQKGHFVYKKHTKTCQNDLISFTFDWMNYNKKISSALMRSSPQTEFALFTLCFLARPGSTCGISLEGNDHFITSHIQRDKFTDKAVATAYLKC